MSQHVILFTMEGCPYCHELKDMFKESNMEFTDLDINEYVEEYHMFTKIVDNDLVAAFMIVDEKGGPSKFMAPDRDYEDLNEALHKIKSIINY